MDQKSEHEIVSLELKYCERCGGLLLRAPGSGVVYCGPCGKRMAELPRRSPRSAQKMSLRAHTTGAAAAASSDRKAGGLVC